MDRQNRFPVLRLGLDNEVFHLGDGLARGQLFDSEVALMRQEVFAALQSLPRILKLCQRRIEGSLSTDEIVPALGHTSVERESPFRLSNSVRRVLLYALQLGEQVGSVVLQLGMIWVLDGCGELAPIDWLRNESGRTFDKLCELIGLRQWA